jgi:hypothetical protein
VQNRGPADTTLTPPGLSKRSIHGTGCGVSHVGEHVRVDIQCKAYVGVAQKLLDELRVDALPEQKRGARVAEIVKPYGRS